MAESQILKGLLKEFMKIPMWILAAHWEPLNG